MSEVVHRPSRLRALEALEANAESSAEALDRITRLACRTLDVPVAIVNLIGADRQRFLGCGPLPEPWASMREMPITQGFCPYALVADDAFSFADASEDPAIAEDPATRAGVVAYAGVPLRTATGEPIGTLCAIDFKRHDWTEDELALMRDLADGALHELQLLAASRLLARSHDRFQALEHVSTALADAHTPDEVLDEVMRAVERTDAGALWRLDDPSTLRTVAAHGERARAVARPDCVPMDASLPPAEVARTGQPRFLSSRAAVGDAFELGTLPDVGAVALLPVSAGDHRIGVLGACFRDERAFSEDDREYLAALAGISGLALAHAN
jgi:GAF domain-containing protein